MQQEREIRPQNGWAMLVLEILVVAAAAAILITNAGRNSPLPILFGTVPLAILAVLGAKGFFVVNPNIAVVVLLFGSYRGTVKRNGFHWTNPFTVRTGISLRARTLNGQKLKVNDRAGNPIEIAAVVVWQVNDTFAARFEVDNYLEFVNTQSETAVRHLASSYPYDGEENELSLRGSTDEFSQHLQKELQDRLLRAGVTVVEARLSHLAYAPEIAGAMLQRQQAGAIIAARQKIVEGAVGMVEDALRQLSERQMVTLDEERKAAMVSNLLVVLCSERSAQPVLNAGTLYN